MTPYKNPEDRKAFYQRNRESLLAKKKEDYAKNKVEMARKKREWRSSHREEMREYDRQRRIKNGDKLRAQARGRYVKNPEKSKENSKRVYSRDKEKAKEYSWYWYHHKRKQIIKETKDRLFEILGGKKCVRCGFTDERALQFDHIDGNGYSETRKIKRGSRARSLTFHRKYVADPDLARRILQVLCANCNWIKRVENEEFYKRK